MRKAAIIALVFLHQMGYAQSKAKSRYVADYIRSFKIGQVTDTLTGMVFLSVDSFTMIYAIRADSDYHFPMFKGTWELDEATQEVNLLFTDNRSVKGRLEDDAGKVSLYLNNDSMFFYRKTYFAAGPYH